MKEESQFQQQPGEASTASVCSPVCQDCGRPLSARLIAYGLVKLRKTPKRCGTCALEALEGFLNEDEENMKLGDKAD